MNVQTIEQPEVEPISLPDVYRQLELTLDPDGTHPADARLTGLIIAARQDAEHCTRRAFVRQKLRASFPHFPFFRARFGGGWHSDFEDDWYRRNGFVELPRPPLIEVTEVSYYDVANQLQVVDAANYFVSDESLVPRLHLIEQFNPPCTYRRGDAFRVEYYAGYAAEDDDLLANVPEVARQAMLLSVQLAYDNLPPAERTMMQNAAESLLNTIRVHSI